jgi:hypothetical protein
MCSRALELADLQKLSTSSRVTILFESEKGSGSEDPEESGSIRAQPSSLLRTLFAVVLVIKLHQHPFRLMVLTLNQ